jgi:hypothetical protein
LLGDANAVPTRLIALQQFKAIPCRDQEIVRATSRVNQPQLPLYHAPNRTRNSTGGARISLTKQIG